jgi:hypothetical protein
MRSLGNMLRSVVKERAADMMLSVSVESPIEVL